jgi:DNA-binding NarL/FixJ family response regulator
MTITVALIEDDAPFANTLQRYLERSDVVRCVGSFHTAEAALEKLPALAPELLLVDINLPKMSGIEFVGRITAACPKVLCLMLTMYEESPLIFDALKAGACGYLLKRTPLTEIVAAIVQARKGGSPMSPEIAREVVRFFHKAAPLPEPAADWNLSEREREVLQLLEKGFLYKEIAGQLGISTHTVDCYLRRIYEKLHVRSRAQAVAKYRKLA